MKEVILLCPFKLKDNNLIKIESEYLKRIKDINLRIIEIKNSVATKIEELKCPNVILLEEKGIEYDSIGFSNFLKGQIDSLSKVLFVIGASEGHDGETLRLKTSSLSLSKLTFPHQLARILLVEQIYRALSILKQHPYHKNG